MSDPGGKVRLDPDEIEVSEHALVRYIERVRGVDLERYRQELRSLVSEHWDATTRPDNHNGATVIVEVLGQPIIVTVLGSAQRPKRRLGFAQRYIFLPLSPHPTDTQGNG